MFNTKRNLTTKLMEAYHRLEGFKAKCLTETRRADLAETRLRAILHDARTIREHPLPHPECLGHLRLVTTATPWWSTIHSILQREYDDATAQALLPNVDPDLRAYRAGRAAALADFAALLHDLRHQANQPAETAETTDH